MKLPLTISDHKKYLLSGEYKIVELIENYLSRIKEFDKEINAFITVSEDGVYETAKKMQRILDDGGEKVFDEFPLLGAPYALKDLYLTEGIRTTAGSKVLENFIPPYSSTVYKRLKKAGGVLIGKTNLDAWAHGASGENSDFGVTKNPWDRKKVPGGSSSGSAAAVAAQFCLFAMGTDTGGSIRQPASFTNTVGLKPTYGAVSRYGVVAMASSLDTMGAFTRSIEDVELIHNIIKGEDGFDATIPQNPDYIMPKDKLKIGIPKEYFGEGLKKSVEKRIFDAVKVLKKKHEIIEVSLPMTRYAISVYYIIQPAEVSSNLARYDSVRFGNSRETFGDEAKRRIMLGTHVLSAGYYDAYYKKAMKVRTALINDFERAFNEVDVLLSPVSPTPAFEIGEKSDDPLNMYLADVLTASVNLAGIPAVSIPAGFTKKGLPVGMQIMAPRFAEKSLFVVAEEFQNETKWHRKTPNLME